MPPSQPSLLGRAKSTAVRRALSLGTPRSVYVARGQGDANQVALTFDDGPDESTPGVLNVLRDLDVRATFCLIGENCQRYPERTRAYSTAGHETTGHGYTHRPFPRLSYDEFASELLRTRNLLPSAATLVRPPRGEIDPKTLLRAGLLGFTLLHWSLDSDDCRSEDAAFVADRIASARPGEIVLLHEGQKWTLDALRIAVPKLRARGVEFVTVSEIARR